MLEVLWMLVFIVGLAEILLWIKLVRALRAVIISTREFIAAIGAMSRMLQEHADAQEEAAGRVNDGLERLDGLCRQMESEP